MIELKPRHEAFCRAYAESANGAAAARAAGYAPENAAKQAQDLLRRDDVGERLAELHSEMEVARAARADILIEKLEPVYEAAVSAGDHDTALRTVELQARVAGLVAGGATIRPRTARKAPQRRYMTDEEALARAEAWEKRHGPAPGSAPAIPSPHPHETP